MNSKYFIEKKEIFKPNFKIIELYTEFEPYLVFPKQNELKEKSLDQIKGFVLRKRIFRPDERAKMTIFEKTLDELIEEEKINHYTFEQDDELEKRKNEKEAIFYKQKRDGIYFYTPKEVRNEQKMIREFNGIYLGDKGITQYIDIFFPMNKKITQANSNIELIKKFNVTVGIL